ncbi:hypothetical protein L202_07443 [Cryptococcus amylolentus CBS 6039]|uniref:RRM domain-containing protein n=1 Tax=Cryptococcus amylolentus CBS 6039 TaxID=1295533 RepID=A0A1E3HC69_9TREE|nr:hypothetical protein L202_07443 [Cryptococcus amylolentus CBS 6039]ODN73939.1 hypothetical protein L202_07443 [Cryptococcus amylolentus CBS 6039]
MSYYPRDPYRPLNRGYSPGRCTPPDSRVSAPAPYRPPSYHRSHPTSSAYQNVYQDSFPPPPSRSPYGYSSSQSRGGYADSYDPYQPSASAYDPVAPQITLPTNGSAYPPHHSLSPHTADVTPRPYHAPSNQAQSSPSVAVATENVIRTPSTTVQISGYAANVYTLPPSHLPLVKYVSTYKQAALDLHQHLTSTNNTVWYSGSCTRAGEAWSTGLEWDPKDKQSGIKTRGVIPGGDSLDAELGGILKCVEGFQDALHKSVLNGTTIANELVIFCDSQAAIVSIDSSSRPEAIRFDHLWREICNEFLYAHLTLAWIPRDSNLEGYVLSSKIASTSAGNSYLKKRKEKVLSEKYVLPGTNDPEAPGSAVGGLWQTGNADPSKPQIPYRRPEPVPPKISVSPPVKGSDIHLFDNGHETMTLPLIDVSEAEDEGIQPKEGAIFVTHFPVEASAKDIGILFAQYGEIIAVDIFHISTDHLRFANVTYASPDSGALAIAGLDRKPISMESSFARENRADLEIWERWGGQLTVVKHEPPRVVPVSVEEFFPNLPDWAKTYGGQQQRQESRSELPQSSEDVSGKRVRDVESGNSSPRNGGSRSSSAEPQNKKARLDQQSPQHPVPHHQPPSNEQNGQVRRPSIHHELPSRPSFALPPTPQTAEPPLPDVVSKQGRSTPTTHFVPEMPEDPITVSAETLRILISTVVGSLVNHDIGNWVVHVCVITQSIDKVAYRLQGDLAAIKEYDGVSREHERVLGSRGFVPARIDEFVEKVLKVLDGIAAAEETAAETSPKDTVQALTTKLNKLLEPFPLPSKNAVKDAGRLLEYLVRGKAAQEKRRLEMERRIKVMEGMIKVGDVVGGVVRYLLTEA